MIMVRCFDYFIVKILSNLLVHDLIQLHSVFTLKSIFAHVLAELYCDQLINTIPTNPVNQHT